MATTADPMTQTRSITIPHRCKLSKVCSTDLTRPVLTHAYLRRRKDGMWLCATDSYIACAVRVAGDADEGWVPIAALRLMERGQKNEQISETAWKVWVNDGTVTFDAEPNITGSSEPPDMGKPGIDLWGEHGTRTATDVGAVGINPKLMERLGAGLGAHSYGCRFDFYGDLRPILVTPLSSPERDRIGLQMPIRIVA